MALNKSKGNMYDFVTHTWNPIRGCNHDCVYCYVRAIKDYDMKPRFVEKELQTKLGSRKTIFVGSTADMFGTWVSDEWITKVLEHCSRHDNTYLFQTKNPDRYFEFLDQLPKRVILGTTIETNRDIFLTAILPTPTQRMRAMRTLDAKYAKMISIEPIMEFNLDVMREWIHEIAPSFVSIGADSKGHNLTEPCAEKIQKLINQLQMLTKVVLKSNLSRLGRFK